MDKKSDYKIWTFVYEPNSFDDIIINGSIKPKLKQAIKDVPNLLLYGNPGVGKGVFTKVLLKETGFDYIWINASDETGIDTMRDKVKSFAFALGSTPLKIVVLNESDSMSAGAQGAQKMLRQLMEDCASITRFILIANYEHLIIDEIKSRCISIKFDNPPKKEIALHAIKILKSENIKFSNKTLLSIIEKCYPDIRKTIWSLQENSINGKLSGSIVSENEEVWNKILSFMLKGDVENVRKTLRSNFIHYQDLYKYLYDNVDKFRTPGDAILEIGQHAKDDNVVAIKEINFMHMVFNMLKRSII